MVLHYLIHCDCVNSMFMKIVFTCFLTLFYQANDSFVHSQATNPCLFMQVTGLVPSIIVSKGDIVQIFFNYTQVTISSISFYSNGASYSFPCKILTLNQSNGTQCITNAQSFLPNNNITWLYVNVTVVCTPSTTQTHRFGYNIAQLGDPTINPVQPDYIFPGHKSNFMFTFPRITRIVLDKISTTEQSIQVGNFYCNKRTTNFETKSMIYSCYHNISEDSSLTVGSKIEISLNGHFLEENIIFHRSRPNIDEVSTSLIFAGAQIPINFTGSNLNSLHDPYISLTDNLNLSSKCNQSETIISCYSKSILEDTQSPIQLNVNLFSHGNIIEGLQLKVTQNPRPEIQYAVYSIGSRKLIINLVDYYSEYLNLTQIVIFDVSKNESIPCSNTAMPSNSSINCTSVTSVPFELLEDYLILRISKWETKFYSIQLEQGVNTITFIITVIIFLLVVILACLLFTKCSLKARFTNWKKHSTSMFETRSSELYPARNAKVFTRSKSTIHDQLKSKNLSKEAIIKRSRGSKLAIKKLFSKK